MRLNPVENFQPGHPREFSDIIGGQWKPLAEGMGSNKHVEGTDCLPAAFKPCAKFSIDASGFAVEIENHKRQKKLL